MSSGAVQTLHAPSGITHCIQAHVFSSEPKQNAVVVIRQTLLELYKVHQKSSGTHKSARLELLHCAPLYGLVQDLDSIQIPYLNYDAILLAFKGMRISILSWDETRFDWRTEQLLPLVKHVNAKPDDAPGVESGIARGFDIGDDTPLLRTDPLGRCFGVLSKSANRLFILPIGSFDHFVQCKLKQRLSIPFQNLIREDFIGSIDLEEHGIRTVKDFVFVNSGLDPSIAVLYSTKQVWSGRAILGACTDSVSMFRVDTQQHNLSHVWTVTDLPFDCESLIGTKEQIGSGVVVLSPNILILVRNGLIDASLVLNSLGIGYVEEAIRDSVDQSSRKRGHTAFVPKTALELDRPKGVFIKSDESYQLALIDSLGEMYFFSLPSELDQDKRIASTRAKSPAVPGSLLALEDSNLIFIASRQTDSVLYELQNAEEDELSLPSSKSLAATEQKPTEAANGVEEQDEIDDIDYGDLNWVFKVQKTTNDHQLERTLVQHRSKLLKKTLLVQDVIVSTGPLVDFEAGRSSEETLNVANAPSDNVDQKLDFVVAGSTESGGYLGVLQRSIRSLSLTKFELGESKGVWTVVDPIRNAACAKARKIRNEKRKLTNIEIQNRNEEIQEARDHWILEAEAAKKALEEKERLERAQNTTEELTGEQNGAMNEDGAHREADEHQKKMDRDELERKAAELYPMEPELVLEDEPADFLTMHSYMFVNMVNPNGTAVLRIEEEITEMDLASAAFVTNASTIAAGNVLANGGIVQVVKSGVKLMRGRRQAFDYMNPHESQIISAEILDPYVLLHLASGIAILLKAEVEKSCVLAAEGDVESVEMDVDDSLSGLDDLSLLVAVEEQEEAKDTIGKMRLIQLCEYGTSNSHEGQLQSCSLYHGPFGSSFFPNQQLPAVSEDTFSEITEENYSKEQEDRLLYLNSASTTEMKWDELKNKEVPHDLASTFGTVLVLLTKSGILEVRAAPTFTEVVFRCDRFFLCPRWIEDEGHRTVEENEEESVLGDLESDEKTNSEQLVESGGVGARVRPSSKRAHVPVNFSSVRLVSVKGVSGNDSIQIPVLVAIDQSGLPVIYRGYLAPYRAGITRQYVNAELKTIDLSGRLRLRFVRVLASEIPAYIPSLVDEVCGDARLGKKAKEFILGSATPFANIAGRGGVFLGGLCPGFLFAERGFLRYHPMAIPWSNRSIVSGFAPVNSINCSHGFVYLTTPWIDEQQRKSPLRSLVSICALPPSDVVTYETPWPIRKVKLSATPHKIAYHVYTDVYGVLVSSLKPTNRSEYAAEVKDMSSFTRKDREEDGVAMNADSTGENVPDQPQLESEEQESQSFMAPFLAEQHELRVLRPDTWEVIDKHELKPFEVGLAVRCMCVDVYKANSSVGPSRGNGEISLFSSAVKLKPKNMMVVGTGYLKGEEVGIRGRLLMFEISRQDNLVGNRQVSTFQMQLIAEKELKGPVTNVASLEGYVIVGVGPKLEVYKLVEDEIVCCSFMFSELFCTSLTTLKHYVLAADMFKSVSFSFWRDRNKSLNFLAKGYELFEAYSAEFLVHDEELGLIVSDVKGNVQLLHYGGELDADARGGTRLLPNGGIYLGSRINRFLRVRDLESLVRPNSAGTQVSAFVTVDGSIGAVVPISDSDWKVLSALQIKLNQIPQLPRYAGLNPRGFRSFKPQTQDVQIHRKGLVDAQLAGEYRLLDRNKRREIARQLNISELQIMATLGRIDDIMRRF